MRKKTKILFYSGHGEIVGGDAKYLFGLIDNLSPDKYEIELHTDRNLVFEERSREHMAKNIKINYLDTRPVLFKKNMIDKVYELASTHKDNPAAGYFLGLLDRIYFGRSGYRIIRYIYWRVIRIITLAQIRENIHNALIFNKLFKDKSRDIDIFHFNNGGYPAKISGLVAIVVAYCHGIKKTVMSIHNVPQKRKWYQISDYVFDTLTARCCRQIINASENLNREMRSRRRFSPDRLTTIYCGLNDTRLFSKEEIVVKKAELGIKQNSPLLLITGTLDEERKGHAVLFRALVDVKKTYPDVILLVAGEGRKKRELDALSCHYKINDNVIFLGYRKDMADINNIIDIAIIPSIGFEATPYTAKEAMRAAKPVISTDAGGCDEAVVNNVTGIVVRQADAGMLARAIVKLLGDRTLMEEMGKEGRKLFMEKFLLSEKILEHEGIYERLLAEKG